MTQVQFAQLNTSLLNDGAVILSPTSTSTIPTSNSPKETKETKENKDHKYSPQEGTEGYYIHETSKEFQGSFTVDQVYNKLVETGHTPANGKSRVSGHFSWMVRHGYCVKAGKAAFTLLS